MMDVDMAMVADNVGLDLATDKIVVAQIVQELAMAVAHAEKTALLNHLDHTRAIQAQNR